MSRDTLLEVFTAAALEAMYFADVSPEDEGDRASQALLDAIAKDCAAFWTAHSDAIMACEDAPRATGFDSTASESEQVAAQAGHDFWLTRQGHGAGFWDGDWPEALGETLNSAADAFPAHSIYVDEDGVIRSNEVG